VWKFLKRLVGAKGFEASTSCQGLLALSARSLVIPSKADLIPGALGNSFCSSYGREIDQTDQSAGEGTT